MSDDLKCEVEIDGFKMTLLKPSHVTDSTDKKNIVEIWGTKYDKTVDTSVTLYRYDAPKDCTKLPEELKYMTKLKEININDMSSLPSVPEETVRLYSEYKKIKDISVLKECPTLESILIGKQDISDISCLSELKNLEDLRLMKNPIQDYSPIKNLHNLKTLEIGGLPLHDTNILKNLINLEFIFCTITDTNGFKHLTNLVTLNFHYFHGGISDEINLDFIDYLSKLENLWINNVPNIPIDFCNDKDGLKKLRAHLKFPKSYNATKIQSWWRKIKYKDALNPHLYPVLANIVVQYLI